MKRKSKVRLYNVIFPVWILMFWPSPPVVLITFFGNLAIDCLVVFFALLALKHLAKGAVLKGCWWKVWLLGFGADLVGTGWMYLGLRLSFLLPDSWGDQGFALAYAPFRQPASFLWTLTGVALAGGCIYLFDRRVMNRCPLLSRRETRILALTLAVVTAPWLFFLPLY